MNINKQKIKRAIVFAVVIFQIFLLSASSVLAVKIPSASSVASQLEKRYHLDAEALRNLGEGLNVSETKKTPPQVMLFFNPTDPKLGEKVTAEALPMYFSNPKESLYFTWYLKRKECDLTRNPSSSVRELCDRDGDGRITANDWKIEAMYKIANAGFDTSRADYSYDNDSDGYEATMGGHDRTDMPNYCYIHDFRSGISYELNDASSISFDCPSGTNATCVENETLICPAEIYVEAEGGTGGTGGAGGEEPSGGAGGTGGSVLVEGDTFEEYRFCKDLESTPTCNSSGIAQCDDGTPACAGSITEYTCSSPPPSSTRASCSTLFGTSSIECTRSDTGPGRNLCSHLFPHYGDTLDEEVGDGRFRADEERFWGTNPQDPSTADNGNKDEANAAGLGISQFEWNYMPGDRIGVVVEGVSMIPTKHDDSSMMIMWAYPNNDCRVRNKGSYYKTISGYRVEIPTANMDADDLNECLEDNLVDPTKGGQPKQIGVSLSYIPENPINDPTLSNLGDIVIAQASVADAGADENQLYYEWRVEMSDNPYDDRRWSDVTSRLIDDELILGPVKGNGISELKIKLNINPADSKYAAYFASNDTVYLRIKVLVREHFSSYEHSRTTREGRTDVIVKATTSSDRLMAYPVAVNEEGCLIFNSYNTSPLCVDSEKGSVDPICFVTKNEVIGVRLYGGDDLTDFSWELNGNPLICNTRMSPLCGDEKQTSINFFPVKDDPGTTYNLKLTAINIERGKSLSFNKIFRVVEPYVAISSTDENACWPKLLGMYRDLDGNVFEDKSRSVFEIFSGEAIGLKVNFHPSYIKDFILNDNELGWIWEIDGAPRRDLDGEEEISFTAGKTADEAYHVSVEASYKQPQEIRKVLKDIWNISQFDSAAQYLSSSAQIEVLAGEIAAASFKDNPIKFVAGLFSYLPKQIAFLVQILLSVFTIVAASGIIFSLASGGYREIQRSRTAELD
jgi:hypothetical protein